MALSKRLADDDNCAISDEYHDICMILTRVFAAAIGRRWSLLTWISIFSVGAVSPAALTHGEAKRLPCLFLDQILQTVAGDSRGLGYIYSGRVISGIGIGAISAVAPAFVSECSPKQVRGRTTGLFQVTIATGVMLSYFINCASLFRRFYSLPLTSRSAAAFRQWALAYTSNQGMGSGASRSASSSFLLAS